MDIVEGKPLAFQGISSAIAIVGMQVETRFGVGPDIAAAAELPAIGTTKNGKQLRPFGQCAVQSRLKQRSDERRVGKECVGKCRSRCSPDSSKQIILSFYTVI